MKTELRGKGQMHTQFSSQCGPRCSWVVHLY